MGGVPAVGEGELNLSILDGGVHCSKREGYRTQLLSSRIGLKYRAIHFKFNGTILRIRDIERGAFL